MWGLLPIEIMYLACLAVNTYAVRGRTNVLRQGSRPAARPRSLERTQTRTRNFEMLWTRTRSERTRTRTRTRYFKIL